MKDIYIALKEILLAINSLNNPDKRLFRHVGLDFGQFERIIGEEKNTEKVYLFPAAFIHFTNVNYMQQAARVNQARATLRIRYVLERYKDNDDFTEIFDVGDAINAAIMDSKSKIPTFITCQREYFDMPTTNNQLTAGWIDFNILFQDASGWKERNYVDVNWPEEVGKNEDWKMTELGEDTDLP